MLCAELPSSSPIPPILHFSAPEPFTKYEMCLIFARILGLPYTHIHEDANPPQGAAAANRPGNTQLDVLETQALLNSPGSLGCRGFAEWWSEWLKREGTSVTS
jgi:S-adenosylmethionine synthetase